MNIKSVAKAPVRFVKAKIDNTHSVYVAAQFKHRQALSLGKAIRENVVVETTCKEVN